MPRKGIVFSFLVLGPALFASQPTHATLIVNGSFESSPVDPGSVFVNLTGGSTALDGWTVIGDAVDYVGTFWQASEGNRSIDLAGSAAPGVGGLEQTFTTVPGVSYDVLFDLAGNPTTPPTIKTLRVSAAGQSADYAFDVTGQSFQDMGWTGEQFTFVANSTETTLQFLMLNDATFWGPTIDNINVVPEPGTLGLVLVGLSCLCFRRGRR